MTTRVKIPIRRLHLILDMRSWCLNNFGYSDTRTWRIQVAGFFEVDFVFAREQDALRFCLQWK